MRAAGDLPVDEAFAADVREGLLGRPKRLSCAFLYDDVGSRLFERIMALPEYYPARAEREILAARARRLAEATPADADLVELGSGNGAKTRPLIDALLARNGRLRYLPIDLSRAALAACERLADGRPTLDLRPIEAEYRDGLRAVGGGRPKLVLWLGSSIGNFEPAAAAAILREVRASVRARDRMLVGIDLRKSPAVLERAYDDARGVTAAFNLNLLLRINRELGGHFDPARFRHLARWEAGAGRVAMYLVARGAQRVAIDRLGVTVAFADGEAIHTESAYKYRPSEIDALAAAAGFAVDERWLDRRRRFSLNLLRPQAH